MSRNATGGQSFVNIGLSAGAARPRHFRRWHDLATVWPGATRLRLQGSCI